MRYVAREHHNEASNARNLHVNVRISLSFPEPCMSYKEKAEKAVLAHGNARYSIAPAAAGQYHCRLS
jgi:hypothetical protein